METVSPYGKIIIDSAEAIFKRLYLFIYNACKQTKNRSVRIGLTGGSTPKAFYQWCTEDDVSMSKIVSRCIWATSDERHVSCDDAESNFGNADRLLLKPLKVPSARKLPWPTELPAPSAAEKFNQLWQEKFGRKQGFDICFLGMGDDGHTASIFPGSSLVKTPSRDLFAAVEVPKKGWRLTITPKGLGYSKAIVVCALGKNKAKTFKAVMEEGYSPENLPIQLLKNYSKRVTWLLDQDAAAEFLPSTTKNISV